MQDLRLVGVHDDGGHLLLSGTGGEMFKLPIDEALRVAASRTPAQLAARASTTPVAMSPRDIQARIRSGATAAEVAELAGLPLANVQRYEGPVLAEREYVAQQARKIEVASPTPGHDVYRAAFGDDPASLDDMVSHRLTAHGIDSNSVGWDSWRRADGSWTVVARFDAPGSGSIGEEPPAMWTFSPSRKSLQNANRWAQQLSELEPLDGPLPARRLTAVSDRPFDFEADAGSAGRAGTAKDSDSLLDMLRSRRGQRLGLDEDGDDALALLLSTGVPAAHPRPSEPADPPRDEDSPVPDAAGGERDTPRRDGRPSILSRLTLAPRHSTAPEDALYLHDGVSTDTKEITVVASPLRPAPPLHDRQSADTPTGGDSDGIGAGEAPSDDAELRVGLDELLGGSRHPGTRDGAVGTERQETPEPAPVERQPSRPKRSSVPSWDEIVFGARGD